ncbi:MAG: hypothetical protein FD145_863 [Candidatus Saganbacteria bacterium]|uniref:PorV/PorQ family protein n=1 Tax=Candidatus Saganbacteria bacterium TaxID=2575572 RepID=A0A833L0W8_UNCSA|nr:MAG: hypothetical protein FD145_863 [Candidatus Saganbacteria bacterium]
MNMDKLLFTIISLLFVLSFQANALLDNYNITPLMLETGARYFGMGATGLAAIDDINAIHNNPGATPWSKGIAISVKNGKNVSASEAYPTGYGTTLGFEILTNNYPNIPNSQNKTVELSSNALILSIGAIIDNEYINNTGVGLSVKNLIGQTFTVSGQPDQFANGWEIDAGILYRCLPWLDIGAVGCNLLPYKALGGGSLNWTNLPAESIPAYYKVGASGKIFGDIKSPFYTENQELNFAMEIEYRKSLLFHLGAEWIFSNQFALRSGLSQNNLYFGGGMRLKDLQFDLSYGKDPINSENQFVISTTYFPSGWFFIAKPIEEISLTNNFETYQSSIEVSGRIKPEVKLSINSASIEADPVGYFFYNLPLKVGENNINVDTFYLNEKQRQSYLVIRNIPPSSPADVFYPIDSQMTYDEAVEVRGKLAKGIESVAVNGYYTPTDINREFNVSISLKIGKNIIEIEGKYDGTSICKSLVIYRKQPKIVSPPETLEAPEVNIKAPKPLKKFKTIRKASSSFTPEYASIRKAIKQIEAVKKLEKPKITPPIKIITPTKEEIALKIKQEKARQETIAKASREAEALRKKIMEDQIKFEALRDLIKQSTELVIIKPVKMKLPAGYLSVYALEDTRYIALKHLGLGRVAVELYISSAGKWTNIGHLPYLKVKNLI